MTDKRHLTVAELEKQCMEDSVRWFGDTVDPKNISGIIHHTLALAGEVGELANIIKKIDRGSLDPRQPRVRFDLSMELTDVFIYVLNLGALLGVDLEEAYKQKRAVNEQRFMAERTRREQRAQ